MQGFKNNNITQLTIFFLETLKTYIFIYFLLIYKFTKFNIFTQRYKMKLGLYLDHGLNLNFSGYKLSIESTTRCTHCVRN